MTHPIDVDRLALEGEGVGRIQNHKDLNGKVAFVPYVLPHEKVEARLEIDKKSYSRWLPIKILKPSQDRVDPACPYFFQTSQNGKWCGGCNWQHISSQSQRKIKKELVLETFQRIGGLGNLPVGETLSSPEEWRFRNKVQVPVADMNGKVSAGFYSPSSHDVVEFDDCRIQSKLSNRVIKFIVDYANSHQWLGYQEKGHKGWLRHLLIRTNRANQALLVLVTKDASFRDKSKFVQEIRNAFPEIIGVHQNVQPGRTNVILGHHWAHVWGEKVIEESIAGLHVQYSPGSFFQVNTGAAELLYKNAVEKAQLTRDDLVIDVYCGVGCLTLLAAQKAKHAVGIEIVSSAIRNAQQNARENNISNVEFEVGKAESFFKGTRFDWLKSEAKNLVIFLDPPRSGCDQRVLEALLKISPKKIVYVSCNPATLARDSKILTSLYQIKSVVPVDLFPQTSHIESITIFEKK